MDSVSVKNGSFPSKITVQKEKQSKTDIEIIAEYTGEAFIDQFGNKQSTKKPYRFAFKKFFQPIDFTVHWYAFDSSANPINTNYGEQLKTKRPFKTENVNQLDYAWWNGIKAGEEQYSQFLTVAEGSAEISKGQYELAVTWDDAVRVYIDGKLVIDEWNPSQYKFDESPHKKIKLALGGTHQFRVEHAELGGFATLALKLERVK
ncbi:MAG TPA: PA14 domain-containing protein [Flavisolibacter sp.]|nr:PA14 domain-containing protein [Flavisolibacter sp.]